MKSHTMYEKEVFSRLCRISEIIDHSLYRVEVASDQTKLHVKKQPSLLIFDKQTSELVYAGHSSEKKVRQIYDETQCFRSLRHEYESNYPE